jgi:Chloramphenicol O-acetyltransferase
MELVKIQFQTPQDLTGFRKVVKTQILEFNIAQLFIICQCSKEQIAIAMNYFGGKIVENGIV